MSARTDQRATAVDRALCHHRSAGAIRTWRRIDTGRWAIDLEGGLDLLTVNLAGAEAVCATLAAAERRAARA